METLQIMQGDHRKGKRRGKKNQELRQLMDISVIIAELVRNYNVQFVVIVPCHLAQYAHVRPLLDTAARPVSGRPFAPCRIGIYLYMV